MPEKIKVTTKELADLYNMELEEEDSADSGENIIDDKKSEFEIYTEQYDEKELKEKDG